MLLWLSIGSDAAIAQVIAIDWDGAVLELDPLAEEPIGSEIRASGESWGFNALARSPSGQLVTVQTRWHGADTAGFYDLDEETGEVTLVHLATFPPDRSGLNNANIGSAAFSPEADLYFTNQVPSSGGSRPIISDLYVMDWSTGAFFLIGSTNLGAIQGMTFGHDGVLYGYDVGSDGSGRGAGLVTLDLETGAANDVDLLARGFATLVQTIAFDSEGRLWGARKDLHELDARSGLILSSLEILPGTGVRGIEFEFYHSPNLDISPGNVWNPINPQAHALIPVAILGSDNLDVEEIDVETLAFGPDGAMPFHPMGSDLGDVDHDGQLDLVSHYRTQHTGISVGDTEACVTGATLNGIPLRACDRITTACGMGFEVAFVLPPLLWVKRRKRTMPVEPIAECIE